MHPPIEESWGISVNEAAFSSLPIIASSGVGSAFDIVTNGKNGYIYSSGDYKELAEKIVSIYGMSLRAVETMGHYSHDVALKDYTYENHLKTLEAILSLTDKE